MIFWVNYTERKQKNEESITRSVCYDGRARRRRRAVLSWHNLLPRKEGHRTRQRGRYDVAMQGNTDAMDLLDFS